MCVTSEFKSLDPVAQSVGSQTNASIPQSRRVGARHCKRWLRLTLGDVPRGVAGRRGGRLERAPLRVPSSPRYTAALAHAPRRSVELLHPTGPTPWLRPRSLPSSTPPEVCQETMEFDIRRRHGTTTSATSVTQESLGHDEQALPSQAFLAPAPSRAAAHVVTIRKEIRRIRCHFKHVDTINFMIPTSNETMGSRNKKTWRHWARGTFLLKAALDHAVDGAAACARTSPRR